MADTIKPAHHGWDHAPGGEDPIPGVQPAWVALYDNFIYGQAITNVNAAGETNLLFPRVELSDNATGILSYTGTADTGGLGSSYDYHASIETSGIYAITLNVVCEDVGGVKFKVILKPGVQGKEPGGTSASLRDQRVYDYTAFATSFFYHVVTWTVPLRISSPLEVIPTIQFIKGSAVSDFSVTLQNRQFITYLGPLQREAGFATGNDPGPP